MTAAGGNGSRINAGGCHGRCAITAWAAALPQLREGFFDLGAVCNTCFPPDPVVFQKGGLTLGGLPGMFLAPMGTVGKRYPG